MSEQMTFEVGGRYRHTTGQEYQVLTGAMTHHWGQTLIAENLGTGELVPLGSDADSAVNWTQVPPFRRCRFCDSTDVGAVSFVDTDLSIRDVGVCARHFDPAMIPAAERTAADIRAVEFFKASGVAMARLLAQEKPKQKSLSPPHGSDRQEG